MQPDKDFITEREMANLARIAPKRVKQVIYSSVVIYSNSIRHEVINGETMIERASLERWLSRLQIFSTEKGETHNE